MKKLLIIISSLFITSLSIGQTILLSENFDDLTSLPSGWKQYNIDGLSPASPPFGPSVVDMLSKDGWGLYANSSLGVSGTGKVALSVSQYTPAGSANDWLVSPQLQIPSTGFQLQYDVRSLSTAVFDSYEIYVSTTGNSVTDFIGSPIYSSPSTSASFSTIVANLSNYSGKSIYIAFRNNSANKVGLLLDNIVVKKPLANDVVLESASLARYSLVNTNNDLQLKIRNNGGNTISSIEVNWNDGVDHNSLIALNLGSAQTTTLIHPQKINYSTPLEKNITISIVKINATLDNNPNNNAPVSKKFNTLSALSDRKVVIEEGTGTWCGFCVRGAVAVEYMKMNYPDYIGIAVHNGQSDPMTIPAYDNANAAHLKGFPGANIDRAILGASVTNENFEQTYLERLKCITPVSLTADVSGTSSSLTVKVHSTFRSNYTNANYKLSLILVEDHVRGNNSSYNQSNYYGIGGTAHSIPLVDVNGLNYNDLPKSIPFSNYEFNNVARSLTTSYSGQTNSIPPHLTDGMTEDYTFTTTTQANWNRENMYAVVLLIDQDNQEIVNACKVSLKSTGIEKLSSNEQFLIYPNPASEQLNIAFEAENEDYIITISNALGQQLISNSYLGLFRHQNITIPVTELGSGTYFIELRSKASVVTKQFMKL